MTNGISFITVCPICLRPLLPTAGGEVATKEDSPPRSLGGSKVVLTCKLCNNTCGTTADIHLVNYIKRLDRSKFVERSDRRVRVDDGGNIINGELKVGANKELTLLVPTKINDRRRLDCILPTWHEDKLLTFSDEKNKLEQNNLNSAILKTAYILLFSHIGYNALLWETYNQIRQQIQEPDKAIVPPLWTMQSLNIKDGIYIVNDCWLRGFIIAFTVTNPDTRSVNKIATLIPAPQTDLQCAHYFLKKIQRGDRLRLWRISEIDYLNDLSNICRLNRWGRGESLSYAAQ